MQIDMPAENLQALEQIQAHMQGSTAAWLVGGSCGLLMQEVAINKLPRDLDIYVDAADATDMFQALKPYAVDQLVLSKTDIYVSMLSHYRIADVSVEVVGGFEVYAEGSIYKVEISGLLAPFGVSYFNNGSRIGLMPLAHELVFNILRERPDRYGPIAAKMRMNPGDSYNQLNKIAARNTFSPALAHKIAELLFES